MLRTHGALELIPAAGRLVDSLRDMGYEFATAVADLVDNSIEAAATDVSIDVHFEGQDSWVRITDNGRGMTPTGLREAMRYGSSRSYSNADLGKFGLGLKVASLSQCKRLSVASRSDAEGAAVGAYCWDLEHIQRTNRWEVVPVPRTSQGPELHELLRSGSGTVVLWERLDRVLECRAPEGESARRRLDCMRRDLEGHLAMVFHRYLAGEVRGRKLNIRVNGASIPAWDPFARDETATKRLKPVRIQLAQAQARGEVTLEPFVLPHQADFSSTDRFRVASGPANWNQQQGFYVYRANRLIQSGGWCRIRSIDEHTKLARVALRFSPQLDSVFRVNVSKMRVELPSWMRDQIGEAMSSVFRIANETYRRSSGAAPSDAIPVTVEATYTSEGRSGKSRTIDCSVRSLLSVADADERRVIRRVAARLIRGNSAVKRVGQRRSTHQ